jgi:hypothetical protein
MKRRHDHMKVFRPNGTRYAEGRHADATDAVIAAFAAWEKEFGAMPRQEQTFIEVMGVTAQWVAVVMEIEE